LFVDKEKGPIGDFACGFDKAQNDSKPGREHQGQAIVACPRGINRPQKGRVDPRSAATDAML